MDTSSEANRSGPPPWRRARHPGRRAVRVAAATVAVGLLAGCGEREERAGTQPAPDVTTFEQGLFDDLPLFPRSEPAGPRREENGVVARSYRARGATPEAVLEHYRDVLDEQRWSLVGSIEQIGVGTYRAEWVSGEHRLRVSATRAPGFDPQAPSDQVEVQYSLTLSPA